MNEDDLLVYIARYSTLLPIIYALSGLEQSPAVVVGLRSYAVQRSQ